MQYIPCSVRTLTMDAFAKIIYAAIDEFGLAKFPRTIAPSYICLCIYYRYIGIY